MFDVVPLVDSKTVRVQFVLKSGAVGKEGSRFLDLIAEGKSRHLSTRTVEFYSKMENIVVEPQRKSRGEAHKSN